MNEDQSTQLDFEPNMGMSFGMYVGDAPVTTYDPFSTGQRFPTNMMFFNGAQESRM